MYRNYLSIDPGIINFALLSFKKSGIVIDGAEKILVNATHNINLKEKSSVKNANKIKEFDLVRYMVTAIEERREVFDDATYIYIEHQMKRKMNILVTVIQTLYPEKVIMIAKTSVHAKLNIPVDGHYNNKKAMIRYVNEYYTQIFKVQAIDHHENTIKKNHNFADCAAMAYYATNFLREKV